MNVTIEDFIKELSSKAPVPGGGGASALVGAIGVSLCAMVGNLTSGKKKYAEYQEDIERMILMAEASAQTMLGLIKKDAEVFEPLSKAYGIPKDTPGRDEVLEKALILAASAPMEMLDEVTRVIDIIEELELKGSRLAISDVAVAAAACKSALEGAVMNVYINSKLMKNVDYAKELNKKATKMVEDGVGRCQRVYDKISKDLRCF